jgi:Lon protease-like protein
MFPLSAVVFPGSRLPLHVFEPRYRQLVTDVKASGEGFGIVLITRGSEVGGGDVRSAVGVRVEVEYLSTGDDGRSMLVVAATERIEVIEWLDDAPYPRARLRSLPSEPFRGDAELLKQTMTVVRRTRALLSEIGDTPALLHGIDETWTPDEAAWQLCSLAPLSLYDAQRLLETSDPQLRLEQLRLGCEAISQMAIALLESGEAVFE